MLLDIIGICTAVRKLVYTAATGNNGGDNGGNGEKK
jgi:hypothetical protein